MTSTVRRSANGQTDALETLIPQEALEARVLTLAGEIRRDVGAGTRIHFVGVLKGAFIFLADLMRACDGLVSCDFIALSSYGTKETSSGEVKLTKDLDVAVEGRDVVIVEDIVDTGLTLSYLQEILRARGPRSLRTVCLLSKPSRRKVDVRVEYIGFDIPDRFVVGYGLDSNERYRNLPFVAAIGPAGS